MHCKKTVGIINLMEIVHSGGFYPLLIKQPTFAPPQLEKRLGAHHAHTRRPESCSKFHCSISQVKGRADRPNDTDIKNKRRHTYNDLH